MPTVRFRITASEDDTQDVIHHVENVDEDIERVEEVNEVMNHSDWGGSSSAGLSDDRGPGFHCVEVEAPNDDIAELVRVAAEERAYRLGAVIEFVDRF
ncbi:MAG TPA: hypothetical protein VK753_09530 [Xanthomonadaceae bacterium]|jgi:hypothetical protein|nr:hypothetical protein [Xanthomonadaceae bacterium]